VSIVASGASPMSPAAGKLLLRRAGPSALLSAFLLTVWFSSSVCSTLVNKTLMDSFPYAVTLAAVHMASAALVDAGFMVWRGLPFTFRKDIFISCLPIALMINFGKTLTYVSYGMVPASLTHTAKASSPVFSVIVSKLMFNQIPSLATSVQHAAMRLVSRWHADAVELISMMFSSATAASPSFRSLSV
jgi:hypothetical protein